MMKGHLAKAVAKISTHTLPDGTQAELVGRVGAHQMEVARTGFAGSENKNTTSHSRMVLSLLPMRH
jgi:hypothetical protein